MKTKNFVILTFTILFLLVSGVFLFFQISEIDKNREKEIKETLKIIESEIQTGYIRNETIDSFKKDLFYLIWIKNVNNNEWYPLIYDNLNLKDSDTFIERDPNKIPKEIDGKTKILKYPINEIDFIIWANSYSITNILKNIVLPILVIVLIYLIILLIINIFFGIEDDVEYNEYSEHNEYNEYNNKKLFNNKRTKKGDYEEKIKKETPLMMPEVELSEDEIKNDYNDNDNEYEDDNDNENEDEDEDYEYQKNLDEKTHKDKKIDNDNNDKDKKDSKRKNEDNNLKYRDDINLNEKLSYELTNDEVKKLLSPIEKEPEHKNKNNEKILKDYEELWQKHFKTSEGFKSNFPFLKLYNTIKFGITPEDYIENGLDIASSYFNWENAQIYIKQKNFFVSTKTKEIIDHEYIDLPTKGDKKGDIFIPLFPYNDTIFGYLYFHWNETENFNIADIIFFLKFLFSEDAKFIFLNYENIEKTIQDINILLNEGNKIFVSILSIDDKDKLKGSLSSSAKESLENIISEKLHNEFSYFEIFNISNFTFGIYSNYENEEQIIEKFDSFIKTKSSYKLPNNGNITLTFSLGITFSEVEENQSAKFLIENSNEKLKRAISEDGNKIIF